jgi:predicted ArsR family transcriptional regulator
VIYALTPAAEELFPRAYDEFAILLLEEARRKGAGDLEDLLRRVGDRWIARDLPRVDGLGESQRTEEAVKILSERGFMPALDTAAQDTVLREHNCPIMRLITAHPELCDVVHRWLETIFGTQMQRLQCQRDGALFSTYLLQRRKPRSERDLPTRPGRV